MEGGFSDLKQSDWIRACRKLGLIVHCSKGKGSHCLIINPKTHKQYTLQKKLHKFLNIKIFKKMMEWGLQECEIWQALK
jgi:predicted RNA binding protein YcfA (HicA-like mRNA interferase family)